MRRVLLSALIVATLASLAGYGWDCFSTSYQRENNLAAERRLQVGLAAKVSLRTMAGQDRRLWDVLRHIGIQTEVPLWWDEAALTMRGDRRTEIVRVPDLELPLESALELILTQTDAVYYEDGSRIVISAEPLTESYFLKVYPLPSLGGNSPAQQSQADDWIDMLILTVASESWADIGGGGTIEPFPGGLAIYQTQRVHRRIRELLDELALGVPLVEAEALSQQLDPLTKTLQEPCCCEFVSQPLVDVVEEFSSRYQIPLTICRPKLEEAGIDWRAPVTLSLKDIRLGSALRMLAEQHDCCWVTRRGVMELTTGEDADSDLRTKAYDVQDLVNVEGSLDFDSLQDLIVTMVSPDRWDERSGPGPTQTLLPGWIIFEQTEEMHRETAELLALLRQGRVQPEKSVNRCISLPPSPAGQRIVAALGQKVIFNYSETPLCEVAQDISVLTGINVVLDVRALEEISVSPQMAINCKLPPLLLSQAVERLTDERCSKSLGWLVRNECLIITAREVEKVEQSLLLLDVRDLVSKERAPNRLNLDRLEDRVRQGIEPTKWDSSGAAGSLSTFHRILLVRGDRDLHWRVLDFLNSPSARGAPTCE